MTTQIHFLDLKAKLSELMPTLRQNYEVESLGIFGSYIHTEQGPNSDLDLLVTFTESPSLLKYIDLEFFLSDQLGVKVDLVMKEALKPRIGARILQEVVPV